jgi:hypothetical protein
MEGKNKILQSLFFLLFTTVFLVLPSGCLGEGPLIINEIMVNGANGEEFIELDNPGGEISLSNYYLAYYSSGREWANPYRNKKFPDGAKIKSGDYFLIAVKTGDFVNEEADWNLGYSAYQLSDSNGSIAIFPNDVFAKENAIDYLSWGKVDFVGKDEEQKASTKNKSLERIKSTGDDWQESYILGGTPGEKNSNPPVDGPKPEEYDAKIRINEVFPHPGDGQEEFLELFNGGTKNEDLSGYIIRDGSKSGKYIFPAGAEIKESDYATINKSDFKFALNDSDETVSLYDPNEKLVNSMNYSNSIKSYSWNFDGLKWRLSRNLTPGKENQLEKIIQGRVEMDKEIYTNIYASFTAKADSDAQKFTWDFGDGHGSSLKETRHKYEKPGKYNASLKITGNGEANLYDFTVEVRDYSAPKVKITSIVPNPKGKDTGEYIVLQNESKEKVNLLGWSIAAGWKNLYNHPITKDFVLKKGQSKKLTKKFSAFALNNVKTKIELRDPTGEVAQKLKYDRTKNKIEDDETFELTGKNWEWNKSLDNTKSSEAPPLPSGEDVPSDGTGEGTDENTGDILIVPDSEIEANIGKFTSDISWENKKNSRIALIGYGTTINTPKIISQNQPVVLGVSDEKYIPLEKHWAVLLFDNTLRKINFGLNWVLNKI